MPYGGAPYPTSYPGAGFATLASPTDLRGGVGVVLDIAKLDFVEVRGKALQARCRDGLFEILAKM